MLFDVRYCLRSVATSVATGCYQRAGFAAGIAAAERSQLARSLRPEHSAQRRRFWIASAVSALIAIVVLVVGMVDLGGDEHWPMGRVLVYNVLFVGAALATLATFVAGLRRPRAT